MIPTNFDSENYVLGTLNYTNILFQKFKLTDYPLVAKKIESVFSFNFVMSNMPIFSLIKKGKVNFCAHQFQMIVTFLFLGCAWFPISGFFFMLDIFTET